LASHVPSFVGAAAELKLKRRICGDDDSAECGRHDGDLK
jgi:hypothetical protein